MSEQRGVDHRCTHVAHPTDNNDDGSIEKDEFEKAKASGQNLNETLVKILDKTFQGDAVTRVTYERKCLRHCGAFLMPPFVLEFVDDVNAYYKALL